MRIPVLKWGKPSLQLKLQNKAAEYLFFRSNIINLFVQIKCSAAEHFILFQCRGRFHSLLVPRNISLVSNVLCFQTSHLLLVPRNISFVLCFQYRGTSRTPKRQHKTFTDAHPSTLTTPFPFPYAPKSRPRVLSIPRNILPQNVFSDSIIFNASSAHSNQQLFLPKTVISFPKPHTPLTRNNGNVLTHAITMHFTHSLYYQ